MSTILDFRSTQNIGSPCNTCMVTVGSLVMNVLTMPLHLRLSALPQTITLPPVGFAITLMPLRVWMVATTSLRSWNDYNACKRMLCLFPNMGVSTVFTMGFIVFVVHPRAFWSFYVFLLSAFSVRQDRITSCWNEVAASASHVRECPIPIAMTRKQLSRSCGQVGRSRGRRDRETPSPPWVTFSCDRRLFGSRKIHA